MMGKHKPTYEPSGASQEQPDAASSSLDVVDAGDYVVVEDALEVRLTGKKSTEKLYYKHSNIPGNLKTWKITRLRERYPEEVCTGKDPRRSKAG